MTPYELSLLLHIYTTPVDFYQESTLLRSETLDHFTMINIICYVGKSSDGTYESHGYKLTKLGEAWLEEILNTPVPKIVYMNHNGKILGDK